MPGAGAGPGTGSASRSSSIAQVRSRQPERRDHARVQLAGMADHLAVERAARRSGPGATERGRPPGRPARPARRAATTRAASTASAQVGRRGPAPTSRAARRRRPARRPGAAAASGSAASSAAISASVGRRSMPGSGGGVARRSRQEHQPDLEQREVAHAAADVADARWRAVPGSSDVRSSGSASDSGFDQPCRAAARVVGGQPERVVDRRRDERVATAPRRSPASASARAIGPAQLLRRGQPAAGRRRAAATDGIVS